LKKKAIIFFLILFLPASWNPSGMAFDDQKSGGHNTAGTERRAGFSFGGWLVSIYRDHISAVDADRCPSLPSCSSYSIKAIKKHGFVIGWMMTVDRLIHEGSEEAVVSPVVFSKGKWKIYDPVKNNDFWWYKQSGKSHE